MHYCSDFCNVIADRFFNQCDPALEKGTSNVLDVLLKKSTFARHQFHHYSHKCEVHQFLYLVLEETKWLSTFPGLIQQMVYHYSACSLTRTGYSITQFCSIHLPEILCCFSFVLTFLCLQSSRCQQNECNR